MRLIYNTIYFISAFAPLKPNTSQNNSSTKMELATYKHNKGTRWKFN